MGHDDPELALPVAQLAAPSIAVVRHAIVSLGYVSGLLACESPHIAAGLDVVKSARARALVTGLRLLIVGPTHACDELDRAFSLVRCLGSRACIAGPGGAGARHQIPFDRTGSGAQGSQAVTPRALLLRRTLAVYG